MNLVLIGGKSSVKIREIVEQYFDNLDIAVYGSLSEFVDITSVRTVSVDRVILLQDAIKVDSTTETKLGSFYEYLCKWYPAVRFVSIIRDTEVLDMMSNIFISPLMVVIHAEKMKPSMLSDLVGLPVEQIKSKYGYIAVREFEESELGGVIDELPSSVSDEPKKEEPKKKRGLFSAFKREKKNKKGVNIEPPQPIASVPTEVTQPAPSIVETPPADNNLVDDFASNFDSPEPYEPFEDMNSSENDIESGFDGGGGMDFSVFELDGATDLGVGVTKSDNTVTPDLTFEEDNEEQQPKISLYKPKVEEKPKKKSLFPELTTTDITEVDVSTPLFDDIDSLVQQYDDKNTKVVERVVEVEVERVVEVEKVVTVGSNKKSYRNGVRTIVVTGDRKTGITRSALNMSKYYANEGSTLYVDLDIERKGSLLYLGIDKLIEEEDRVQNGLQFFKSTQMLKNLVYTFPNGGFDCLVSMFGAEIEPDDLINTQRLLSNQKDYKTLIIDCPFENLKYLEDILLYAEVFVCTETSLPSVLNTVLGLSKFTTDDKLMSVLFNSGTYFLSNGGSLEEFLGNMEYIVDMFSLDEEVINWGNVGVSGSVEDFNQVLSRF